MVRGAEKGEGLLGSSTRGSQITEVGPGLDRALGWKQPVPTAWEGLPS